MTSNNLRGYIDLENNIVEELKRPFTAYASDRKQWVVVDRIKNERFYYAEESYANQHLKNLMRDYRTLKVHCRLCNVHVRWTHDHKQTQKHIAKVLERRQYEEEQLLIAVQVREKAEVKKEEYLRKLEQEPDESWNSLTMEEKIQRIKEDRELAERRLSFQEDLKITYRVLREKGLL